MFNFTQEEPKRGGILAILRDNSHNDKIDGLDKYISSDTVAKQLGIKRKSLAQRRWLKKMQEIRTRKAGKIIMYHYSDFKRYLEAHNVEYLSTENS